MKLARQLLALGVAVGVTVGAIIFVHEYDTAPWWMGLGAEILIGAACLAYLLTQPHVRRWLAVVTTEQWRAIDRETEPRPPGSNPHLRVLVILMTCAVTLTIQEYVGGSDKYELWFPYDGSEYWELKGFVWWSAWRVIGYVVIPVLVLVFMPGERIRDHHLSGRGFFRHLWIYAVMFVAFSPILIVASVSSSFRDTYPFYRMANRSHFDLWAWESLYVVQFISLEFFFRGFLLRGLRRVLGANSIFVMMVPYCMIHYGKPLPETIGAILAGLILGTLAMRTRSIWGGVVIHVGVAMTMDVLALRGCPPMGSDSFCHT